MGKRKVDDGLSLVINTVADNKCSLVESLSVEPDFNVFVPDVFTPNGDGLNDVFEIKGTGLKFLQLTIFDRWGNTIFESNELNAAWNGTYKALDCPQGAYNWNLNVTARNGWTKSLNGKVMLVR